jgi:hypothetical protein
MMAYVGKEKKYSVYRITIDCFSFSFEIVTGLPDSPEEFFD